MAKSVGGSGGWRKLVRDSLVGVLIGLVAGVASGVLVSIEQAKIDDARSEREATAAKKLATTELQLANLRWVRDRSSSAVEDRPFQSLDLRNLTLSGLSLEGSDFQYAEMSGVYMSDSDLRGADLSGAFLGDANFSSADLAGANLAVVGGGYEPRIGTFQGANLVSTDLTGVSFEGFDLAGANLTGAILGYADLHNAELKGVNLSGICWDKNTYWPKGFKPPKSADYKSCVLASAAIYYAARGQSVPAFVAENADAAERAGGE